MEKDWIHELIRVMELLRSESGCPWDREQTHHSISHNLLEEAYETYEAILHDDEKSLKEELGDLLLQIVFHAQIAKERQAFDIQDVAKSIVEKLIRRHPHVFEDLRLETADEVLKNWEKIKQAEKESKESEKETHHTLDSIPVSMPALLYAYNVQKKASRLGFDWEKPDDAAEKLNEESDELKEAYLKYMHAREGANREKLEEEIGDLLFSAVNLARLAGLDPEYSLRKVTEKFISRVKYVQELAEKEGLDLTSVSIEKLDELWEIAKRRES